MQLDESHFSSFDLQWSVEEIAESLFVVGGGHLIHSNMIQYSLDSDMLEMVNVESCYFR